MLIKTKSLLLVTVIAGGIATTCKSRYKFVGGNKEGAENDEEATPTATPQIQAETPVEGATTSGTTGGTSGSTAGTTSGTTGTSSGTTSGGVPSPSPTPTPTIPIPGSPGGPIVGMEAVQNGVVVTKILTGIRVTFRLTSWSRDTDNNAGCVNPGLIHALWSVGPTLIADKRRTSLSDCTDLSGSGAFTKPGTVTVNVDVMSDEGEGAYATGVYEIVQNADGGNPSDPGQK